MTDGIVLRTAALKNCYPIDDLRLRFQTQRYQIKACVGHQDIVVAAFYQRYVVTIVYPTQNLLRET
jgi:hypothetical protein